MVTLKEIYQEITQFTNGEAVVRRMLQLEALARDPEDEYLAISAHRVMNIIAEREGRLLNIDYFTQYNKHFPLKRLIKVISETEDPEFDELKRELNISGLQPSEKKRLFADESGKVSEDFDQWVLGKDGSDIPSVEGQIIRTFIDSKTLNKK